MNFDSELRVSSSNFEFSNFLCARPNRSSPPQRNNDDNKQRTTKHTSRKSLSSLQLSLPFTIVVAKAITIAPNCNHRILCKLSSLADAIDIAIAITCRHLRRKNVVIVVAITRSRHHPASSSRHSKETLKLEPTTKEGG